MVILKYILGLSLIGHTIKMERQQTLILYKQLILDEILHILDEILQTKEDRVSSDRLRQLEKVCQN